MLVLILKRLLQNAVEVQGNNTVFDVIPSVTNKEDMLCSDYLVTSNFNIPVKQPVVIIYNFNLAPDVKYVCNTSFTQLPDWVQHVLRIHAIELHKHFVDHSYTNYVDKETLNMINKYVLEKLLDNNVKILEALIYLAINYPLYYGKKKADILYLSNLQSMSYLDLYKLTERISKYGK